MDHDFATYKALAGAIRYEAERRGMRVEVWLDVPKGCLIVKPIQPQKEKTDADGPRPLDADVGQGATPG